LKAISIALQFTFLNQKLRGMRVFDLLFKQYTTYKIEDSLSYKVNGKWVKFSTSQVISVSSKIALSLLDLGIKKGDKIGLVSENRPEWNFIDFACQQIGVVLVPMYPTIGAKDYRYIIEQSEIKALFVSTKEILGNVREAIKEKPIDLFSFNKISGVKSWRELLEQSKSRDINELKPYRAQVNKTDLLTIIYTSGTTGNPKGVMLTHNNIVSNVKAITTSSTLEPGDRALSFLPLNHVFERTIVYAYVYNSIGVYYAESLESIGDNLKEIKPHTFNTVPRLLEKVYDKIIKKGNELSGLKKGIFSWAINLGLKYDPSRDMGAIYNKQLAMARKLVFSKWQEALGGNIKQIGCGAASLQDRLARVFWAADIKILEGYGLTETSPAVCASKVDEYKVGCVGKPLEGVELKFDHDGEILVKGPNVMAGYYKNQTLTQELIEDGWFRTGDIGRLEDGFLKITDRKKEMFKTSGGLYVAPQQIENKLKESPLVEQAMVVGDGKKFPAALIVPNYEELVEEAGKNFIMAADLSEMVKDEGIRELFDKELERTNKDMGQWEKIKDYRLIPNSWTLEGGELTPTMKLKRRVILEKYQSFVSDIYKEDGTNLFDNMEEVNMEEMEKQVAQEIKNE